MLGQSLTAAEAALYESLVVSRYMRAFGEPTVQMLIPHTPARVAHLGCRTGYPAAAIGQRLPGCTLIGVDNSPHVLELALTKASLMSGISARYTQTDRFPTPLAEKHFTHAFALHPTAPYGDYRPLFHEMCRLLTPGGQMVVAMPIRGSFPEIYDMMREYALRHDLPHFGESVDAAAAGRPNPETLAEQVQEAGFSEVDVAVELATIGFEHGKDFLDDPIGRLVVVPDVRASLPVDAGVDAAMRYVSDAIMRYWSEINFELTLNIGSVSARKL